MDVNQESRKDNPTATSEDDGNVDIIKMENIHKTYLMGITGVAVLRGVSLRVKKGEFVAIYGPSGGGKSTMLSIMGTIDRHSKGDLYLFGQRINLNTKDSLLADYRLRKIGFVFQAFNLLPTLSAFENVELPMVLAGKPKAERTARTLKLLERVGMSNRAKSFPAQLSGGEQQRVTIARALANRPSLLLMDEPSGDLDSKNTDLIMKFLLDLHEKQNITMVMVTHDVGLRSYADRVVQFRDGKVVGDVTIPPQQRQRMRAELREQVHRSQNSTSTSSKTRPQGITVEIRQPQDYLAASSQRESKLAAASSSSC